MKNSQLKRVLNKRILQKNVCPKVLQHEQYLDINIFGKRYVERICNDVDYLLNDEENLGVEWDIYPEIEWTAEEKRVLSNDSFGEEWFDIPSPEEQGTLVFKGYSTSVSEDDRLPSYIEIDKTVSEVGLSEHQNTLCDNCSFTATSHCKPLICDCKTFDDDDKCDCSSDLGNTNVICDLKDCACSLCIEEEVIVCNCLDKPKNDWPICNCLNSCFSEIYEHTHCNIHPYSEFTWPSIAQFSVQCMLRDIQIFCHSWKCDLPWTFYTEMASVENRDFITFYKFETIFYVDMKEYPVPQSRVSVYFFITINYLNPKTTPVQIVYQFEGNRTKYQPRKNDNGFQEFLLKTILDNKIRCFKRVSY